LAAAVIALVGAAQPVGQSGPSPQDVDAGGRLYQRECSSCHGANGDQLPSVHLMRGKFSWPNATDSQLVEIIIYGTPNELMPPTSLARQEAQQVVAFLRARAAAQTTTATTTSSSGSALPAAPSATSSHPGRSIFDQSGCLNCHRIGSSGSDVGPDLGAIGASRSGESIRRSIVDPHGDVRRDYRFYRVVTRAGTTVTGRLLNHDTWTVQLMDTNNRLLSFEKATLREHGVVQGSPMPASGRS
jgi:putative heme-binding domain-containing protein